MKRVGPREPAVFLVEGKQHPGTRCQRRRRALLLGRGVNLGLAERERLPLSRTFQVRLWLDDRLSGVWGVLDHSDDDDSDGSDTLS